MSELSGMRNLGKEMEKKLKSVGIDSPERLVEVGAKQAFLTLKGIYPNICLVHLYVLQGAIDDIGFDCLSEDMKKELKEFSDSFK